MLVGSSAIDRLALKMTYNYMIDDISWLACKNGLMTSHNWPEWIDACICWLDPLDVVAPLPSTVFTWSLRSHLLSWRGRSSPIYRLDVVAPLPSTVLMWSLRYHLLPCCGPSTPIYCLDVVAPLPSTTRRGRSAPIYQPNGLNGFIWVGLGWLDLVGI